MELIFLAKYPSFEDIDVEVHSLCSLTAESTSHLYQSLYQLISSCYVSFFCQSLGEWKISSICHVLAYFGSLKKIQAFKRAASSPWR